MADPYYNKIKQFISAWALGWVIAGAALIWAGFHAGQMFVTLFGLVVFIAGQYYLPKDHSQKKKRGIFLTAIITLTIVAQMPTVYFLINPPKDYAVSTPSDVAITMIFLAVTVVSMVGMLMWKKWAIYLLISVFVINFLYGFLGPGIKINKDPYIDSLLVGGLWFLALRNKWKYFT